MSGAHNREIPEEMKSTIAAASTATGKACSFECEMLRFSHKSVWVGDLAWHHQPI
jgi:hypothetical protein